MLTSNKKWFGGIAIVIVVLFVSLTLLGQNHSKKNNSGNYTHNSSWWNSNVPEKYWLGDDQINQVTKIKTEYDELIQPEIEKLNTLRGDYSDYKQQDDISSKRIREYQSELRGIEDHIYSLKMEAGSKIRKVLTNSQRVYFNDSRIGWWDGFYGRCGWDYADMNYGMRTNGYMDYGMRGHGGMYNHGGCW
ncbi:MAG: hypothetical protein FD143_71 [Ignavibacteria bacterium]|nr:MAG: hypothetical protein FD143_71 [Ignavibacteria bacterium]KAF0162514.1 MAG: hypothetical protein FD188_117 [Ignavibacteria bacterium]